MKTVIRTLSLRLHGGRVVAAVEDASCHALAMAIFGTVYLLRPT